MVDDGRQIGWKTSRLVWGVDLGHPARSQVIRPYGLVGHEPGSRGAGMAPDAHEATLSPDGTWLFVAYGNGNNGVMQQAKFIGVSPRDFVVLMSESFASWCREENTSGQDKAKPDESACGLGSFVCGAHPPR